MAQEPDAEIELDMGADASRCPLPQRTAANGAQQAFSRGGARVSNAPEPVLPAPDRNGEVRPKSASRFVRG